MNKRTTLFGLGVLALFLSAPLYMDYLPASRQLGTYFLETEGIRGPFLMLPLLLARMGMGIQGSCRLYILLMNILACVTSYGAFRFVLRRPLAALAGSICYCLSLYSVYIRYDAGSMGEMTAFVWLPLVVLGMAGINRERKWNRNSLTGVLWLTVGMTGLFYAHLPVAIITFGFTVLACLLLWGSMKNFICALMAVGSLFLSLVLSLPVLLTFVRAVRGGAFYISDGSDFAGRGLMPVQLFQVFFGYAGVSGELRSELTFVGLGLPFVAILIIYLLLRLMGLLDKRTERLGGILAVMSVLAMILSLKAFPWENIASFSGSIRTLLEQLGYPHRFLVIATLLLSLLVGLIGDWTGDNRGALMGIYMAAVITCNVMSGVYLMNDLVYTVPGDSSYEAPVEWQESGYNLYICK